MNEMDKFMMQLTAHFGRVVLISMFLPLGVFGGCRAKARASSRRS